MRRYGVMGERLYHLSRGQDDRAVHLEHEAKSISAETTFNEDYASAADLVPVLRGLSEKVSERLKAADIAGRTVVLKLKTRTSSPAPATASWPIRRGSPTGYSAPPYRSCKRNRRHRIPPDRHRRGRSRRRRHGRSAGPDRCPSDAARQGGSGDGQGSRQIRQPRGGDGLHVRHGQSRQAAARPGELSLSWSSSSRSAPPSSAGCRVAPAACKS